MMDLEREIDQMAEQLYKSAKTRIPAELEQLIDQIMTFGPLQLRKAAEKLPEDQKTLLKSVLEKALSSRSVNAAYTPPKEQPVNAAAEPTPKNVKDLDSHEIPKKDGGADDEDEQLVEEKNAKIEHQGDASPEGKERQKVEDPTPAEKGTPPADEQPAVNGTHPDFHNPKDPVAKDKIQKSETDLERLQKAAKKNPDEKADAKLGEKVEAAVEQHAKENKPAEKKEGHDFAKAACATSSKQFDAFTADEKKKHLEKCGPCKAKYSEMKKAKEPNSDKPMDHNFDEETVKKMMYRAMERHMDKDPFLAQFKKKGYEMSKMYGMWDEMHKTFMSQFNRANSKDSKAESKPAQAEAKGNPPKDEKPAKSGKMKKSIQWTSKTDQLLRASTRRGQNTHYDVDAMVAAQESERQETMKKGGYFGETEVTQALAKSNTSERKVSVNDLIEKGFDMSEYNVVETQTKLGYKPENAPSKESFSLKDLAKSMNLSSAEVAKILGESQQKD